MIFEVSKTQDGVMLAIARAFSESGRKRTFVVTAEEGGNRIAVCPESNYESAGKNFSGFRGVDRWNWKHFPGYAENVCSKILSILNYQR